MRNIEATVNYNLIEYIIPIWQVQIFDHKLVKKEFTIPFYINYFNSISKI